MINGRAKEMREDVGGRRREMGDIWKVGRPRGEQIFMGWKLKARERAGRLFETE